MTHRFTFGVRSLLLFLLALSSDPLRCGAPTTDSLAGETPPWVMISEGKTTQGFPYLSGGVSSNEREIMEERSKAYNVKLTFAEKRGSYLSDVRLAIEGTKGAEIIAITTNGPLFYIQLPPGSYTIKATLNGAMKEIKNLKVEKAKPVHRVITWDLGEPAEKLE